MAGLKTQADYDLYEEALQASNGGFSIILERDIDELYVNSYNPEWAAPGMEIPIYKYVWIILL